MNTRSWRFSLRKTRRSVWTARRPVGCATLRFTLITWNRQWRSWRKSESSVSRFELTIILERRWLSSMTRMACRWSCTNKYGREKSMGLHSIRSVAGSLWRSVKNEKGKSSGFPLFGVYAWISHFIPEKATEWQILTHNSRIWKKTRLFWKWVVIKEKIWYHTIGKIGGTVFLLWNWLILW